MNLDHQVRHSNRLAFISLVAAILAIVSMCTAIAPIPLTGLLCFPSTAILGGMAIVTGLSSLAQIRSSGDNGTNIAIAGVIIGGAAVLAAVCIFAFGIVLLERTWEFIGSLKR